MDPNHRNPTRHLIGDASLNVYHRRGKSQLLIWVNQSTISMAIFNRYVTNYQRVYIIICIYIYIYINMVDECVHNFFHIFSALGAGLLQRLWESLGLARMSQTKVDVGFIHPG